MMENVPTLFYNQISNKAFEVIGFIKDYLSNNYMGKYRKMKESNLCSQERILLLSLKDKIGLSENEYVYNGYILNSSDRIILVDIEKDSSIFYGSFLYVSDPKSNDFNYINCFIINKKILDEIDPKTDKGTIQILKLAYHIIERYFFAAIKTEDSVINRIAKRSNSLYKHIINYSAEYDSIFYIDYLISAIMILDVMFNLKFGDIYNVKSALELAGAKNNIIDNCFEEIYNYSIDMNPDSEDYMTIFKKIFNYQ